MLGKLKILLTSFDSRFEDKTSQPQNTRRTCLEANEDERAPSGMGTGFTYRLQHHIVTNHVVKERNGKADTQSLQLQLSLLLDDVTLIGYDEEADIAVLRINKDIPV